MTAQSAGTVFVVDDDAGVRHSMHALFASAGFAPRTYPDAKAFLSAFHTDMVGCLILDYKMPGISGIECQAELSRRGSQLPILFLSAHGSIATSVRAMRHGAVDFLVKPVDPQKLVERVRLILRDSTVRQLRWAQLTGQERRVLACIANGHASKAVAAMLEISPRTVEGHRNHLMRKLCAHNVLELANLAREYDLSAFMPVADRDRPD